MLQSLSGSHLLGETDGNATSNANWASMYCVLEAQHSIIRVIKRLTFSSSMMNPLMIRTLMLQVP